MLIVFDLVLFSRSWPIELLSTPLESLTIHYPGFRLSRAAGRAQAKSAFEYILKQTREFSINEKSTLASDGKCPSPSL